MSIPTYEDLEYFRCPSKGRKNGSYPYCFKYRSNTLPDTITLRGRTYFRNGDTDTYCIEKQKPKHGPIVSHSANLGSISF